MSLKHVVHRRVHKERHQPAARKRLGYLEKHKDYVKRAKDFHKKQDHVKRLERKAFFKNEDEFAYSMLSYLSEGGKLSKKGKKHLEEDELRLAESQDTRYVTMREQIDRKAAEKKAEQLHFLEADRPNKHILFVDEDDDEGQASAASSSAGKAKRRCKLKEFDVAKHFDTHPALLKRKANRPRLKQLESRAFADVSATEDETRQAYRDLVARQERAKRLRVVREELELRTHLRAKGTKPKQIKAATDSSPAVYKWASERKR